MTAFHFIYRVGRVVVKRFVLQGREAVESLELDRVRVLAERCAEKIRGASLVQ